MPIDPGFNQAKEGREAPIESALKRGHRVVEALEEQAAILEARLARLIAQSPSLIATSMRDGAGTRPPEPPRAEMTRELSELFDRVEASCLRLRHVVNQLDC